MKTSRTLFRSLVLGLTLATMALPQRADAGFVVVTASSFMEDRALNLVGGAFFLVGAIASIGGNSAYLAPGLALMALPAPTSNIEAALAFTLPGLNQAEITELASIIQEKVARGDLVEIATSNQRLVCLSEDETLRVLEAGNYAESVTARIVQVLGC